MRNKPTGFPIYIDLDINETVEVKVRGTKHRFTLHTLNHSYEPDYWIEDNPVRQTIREAQVALEVDGEQLTLTQRPYALPVDVGGMRLYVESTHHWATNCNLAALTDLRKAVRLSLVPAGQGWSTGGLRFPIANYRWRSSSYNNTWAALVPYNLLYYHRGDDFGAIPDRLDVLAMLDGEITQSPVPDAKGSNSVAIQGDNGLCVHYAHMNIETIDPALVPGARVKAGQVLGKTGCTWNGWHSQHNDPHLHIAMDYQGKRISSYPYLVEAYLRDYPDPALAVAGGYRFTTPGSTLLLDASHSIARETTRIVSYQWHLHDGRTLDGAVVAHTYATPGQYAEILTVTTESGFSASDVVQVRVYASAPNQDVAHGWVYASPVRGVKPGIPVLIWNRLQNTVGPVTVNFGDGSPVCVISESTSHHYKMPGLYHVSLQGHGQNGTFVMASLPLTVE